MSTNSEPHDGDEQVRGSNAGRSLSQTARTVEMRTSTRRAALGLTAAATAGVLADRALLAPGTARASGEVVESINGKTGKVTLVASEVGAIAETEKGAASGVAELDSHGSVLSAIASGARNTAVGEGALGKNKSNDNVAVGTEALTELSGAGSSCTAVGSKALKHCNGPGESLGEIENTAIGTDALRDTTTGIRNTAIGAYASAANKTGEENCTIGNGALENATAASLCTAVGALALAGGMEKENTALGALSGYRIAKGTQNLFAGAFAGNELKEGNENSFLGHAAGNTITKGNGNVCIGINAGPAAAGEAFHSLYIATEATNSPLIGGEFPNKTVALNAEKLGFNKKAPVSLIGENLSTGALKVKASGFGFETEAQAKAVAKFIELFSKWAHEAGLTA